MLDINDPDMVGKKLTDEQIKSYIHTLQTAICQLGKDLQDIKKSLSRDKKDQWQYISDLGKKIEELESKCRK